MCSEKSKRFRSLDAVRKHMFDKGHSKLAFSGGDALAEFAHFYDYSKSYPENGQEVDETDEVDEDMEIDINAIDDTGYELVLPSGAKIGHRSLVRYYRQSLNPDRQVVLKKPSEKILDQYRTFGVFTNPKEAKRRAKDVKYFKAQQQKYYMKLGTKTNKLMKYFRDPTMVFG